MTVMRTPHRLFLSTLLCSLTVVSLSLASSAQPIPPGAGVNWKALYRDGTSGGNFPQDYDFTGLTFVWQTTTQTVYAQAIATNGPFGGMGAPTTISGSVSGTSTYKWEWLPPTNLSSFPPPGQRRYDLFPADPLFALGWVDVKVEAAPAEPGHTAGLTASGTVRDGWGWERTFNTIPGSAPADLGELPRRNVIPANGGNVAAATVSPFAAVTGSGVPAGDQGGVGLYLKDQAFPILLSSPNVFGRPDLGDGRNQFVYGPQYPVGRLAIPTRATVPRASVADLTWLADPNANPRHVYFVSNGTIPGGQPYNPIVSGESIVPLPTREGAIAGDLEFEGLPASATGFDNVKYIYLLVENNLSQKARVETFFDGMAYNHSSEASTIRNWYYYYNQVYPAPGEYNIGGPQTRTFFPVGEAPYILIGDSAFNGGYRPAFEIRDLSEPPFPPLRRIQTAGQIYVQGIHWYIMACEHEKGHISLTVAGIELNYEGARPPADAGDGDGVDDAWELRNNLDPTDSDTTDYYRDLPQGSADVGKEDRECLCDLLALGGVRPHKDKWLRDWAKDIGLRWGQWGPHNPDFAAYFGASVTTPYHPWAYWPNSGPTTFDPDWGSVLTSLSQLDGGGQ
jgi:hypothetical protein